MSEYHKELKNKAIFCASSNLKYIVLYNQTMVYIYELNTLKCVFKHRCYYAKECIFIKNDSICMIFSSSNYILKVDMKSFETKRILDTEKDSMISNIFVTSKYLVYFKDFWKHRLQCAQLNQLNIETDEFKRDEIIKGRIIIDPCFHTKEIKFATYIPNKHDSKELMEYKENDEGEIVLVKKEKLDESIYNVGDVYESNDGVYKYIYYSFIGKLEIYKNQVKVYEKLNLQIYKYIYLEKNNKYLFFFERDKGKQKIGCLLNLETFNIEKRYIMFACYGVCILYEKRKLIISGYFFDKEEVKEELETYIFDI